jgi:phage recombination protein Bet
MSTAITKSEEPFFTEEQQKIIRDSYLNGATQAEASMLMEVAKALRLSPLKRHICFVKRSTKDYRTQQYKDVWSHQVTIDGFRYIAERTGRYDGQDEPEFEEGATGPMTCTVRVYKKGISRPFVGKVWWEEYVQTNGKGEVTNMWARGKHFMLAKCAEAVALRKAFPEDLAGAYTPEEMARDEKEVNEAPVNVAPKSGPEAVRAALANVKSTGYGSPVVLESLEKHVNALPAASTESALKASVVLYKKRPISEMTFDELQAGIADLNAWLADTGNKKGRPEVQAKLDAMTAEATYRETDSMLSDAQPPDDMVLHGEVSP